MNPRYYLITIIIAGMVICGIYLFTIRPLSSPKISGTGTVNITGGSQYTLISDNGTVYYPLNPEVIHYPPGTRVYGKQSLPIQQIIPLAFLSGSW